MRGESYSFGFAPGLRRIANGVQNDAEYRKIWCWSKGFRKGGRAIHVHHHFQAEIFKTPSGDVPAIDKQMSSVDPCNGKHQYFFSPFTSQGNLPKALKRQPGATFLGLNLKHVVVRVAATRGDGLCSASY